MEFTLKTSGYFYPNKEERIELEKLGFTFRSIKNTFTIIGNPTIEIKDLNELIKFIDDWDRVVISGNDIEIYDDYRE